MPEWLSVGPVAPILGAIVGSLATIALTLFLRSRKRVTFWVEKGENLSKPLKQRRRLVRIKVDDLELRELNRAAVVIKNTGNASIPQLSFLVELYARGEFNVAEIETDRFELRRAIEIKQEEGSFVPTWEVKVDFLNPREEFAIQMFYDGDHDVKLEVECRLQDLKTEIRKVGAGEGGTMPDLQKALWALIGVSWSK